MRRQAHERRVTALSPMRRSPAYGESAPPSLNPDEVTPPEVYPVLAQHQTTHAWDLREVFEELQRWKVIFDREFCLDVGDVSLCVEWLPVTRLGHFRYGHNGFGLWGEIAINRRYLAQRPFWMTLGTLLHELFHAWQQRHGRPGKGNYHNVEFRDKARGVGLAVDEDGRTQYRPDSAFLTLLAREGVEIPGIPSVQTRVRGQSKLKKWSCGCTNVRVAVADFRAVCLNCGSTFECTQT